MSMRSIRTARFATVASLSLALAAPLAALAQSAAPPSPPAAAQAAPAGRPAPEDRLEHHLTRLHDELKITPAQQPQWDALAQVMRDNFAAMRARFEERRANPGERNALDRLQREQQMAQARLDGLQKMIPPFQGLYSSLSDEQKQAADKAFGRMERDAHHHHGPKHELD
jgi:hypothetical protein